MQRIKKRKIIPPFRKLVAILLGAFAVECSILVIQNFTPANTVGIIITTTVAVLCGIGAWRMWH